MMKDPIVEEVHQIREKMLADHGGDVHKLMEHLRRNPLPHNGPRVTKADLDRQKQVEPQA